MMRILSLVLAYADGDWTRRCLQRIDTDLLIIDNDAREDVKNVILNHVRDFKGNWKLLVNEQNIFVNPGWNQGAEYFLKGDWTHLAIINSDLVLEKGWSEVIKGLWTPDIIPCVNLSNDKRDLDVESYQGVFIFISREQVEKSFPIPDLKLWFGENWIDRKLGLKKRMYHRLKAVHGNSRSVSVLDGFTDIIEQDKKIWNDFNW